jgi:hypothetical protein
MRCFAGAFSLDGTDYLFEAKWQQDASNASELDAFAAKVRRKLENTLGVFLSINGFSQDGVVADSAGGAVVILADGADLMAVLEERLILLASCNARSGMLQGPATSTFDSMK